MFMAFQSGSFALFNGSAVEEYPALHARLLDIFGALELGEVQQRWREFLIRWAQNEPQAVSWLQSK